MEHPYGTPLGTWEKKKHGIPSGERLHFAMERSTMLLIGFYPLFRLGHFQLLFVSSPEGNHERLPHPGALKNGHTLVVLPQHKCHSKVAEKNPPSV